MNSFYKILTIIGLSLISIILIISCDNHLIKSASIRKEIKTDLNAKLDTIGDSFNFYEEVHTLTKKEKEALEFLYAYMPLADIADLPVDYFIRNIRLSFKAQKEMPWSKKIPDNIFRHFVLPIRVNNETLDESRKEFYKELKPRVENLSMYDAALEVNHWCHEKVIYKPSDSRTSSPLNSIKTAYGRCGEESVLTCAALRSIGIPARQVYTPRWAHTDDNHAWVECWINGKWHYLGACEPAPKLDFAWFSSTAQRGMLMHSRVFGKYKGDEDIISTNHCGTETNATSTYAPTVRQYVTIADKKGNPVSNATVEFKIYNYAEFYSAITTKTGSTGKVSAILGKGDILVWASYRNPNTHEKSFGYRKISVGKDNEDVTVTLDKHKGKEYFENIDIIPPISMKAVIALNKKEVELCNKRMKTEDSIRTNYTNTFVSENDINIILEKYPSLNSKKNIIKSYLIASKGNWKSISKFIGSLNKNQIDVGFSILANISQKDLRDITFKVLAVHLNYYFSRPFKMKLPAKIQDKYLISPRISNEFITPWRKNLQNKFGIKSSQNIVNDKLTVEDAIKNIYNFSKKIIILDSYNPENICISPDGTMKLKVSTTKSRMIFFVAACRSVGIPARIESVENKLQYYLKDQWHNVSFDSQSKSSEDNNPNAKGRLILTYHPSKYLDNPKFDTHFTIAKLSDLKIHTLNFRNEEGYEGTVSWKSISRKPILLDQGYYMLTTGTRMASGKVLATITFFNIEPDKTTRTKLIMRQDLSDLQVIGNLNPEAKFIKIKDIKTAKAFSIPVSILNTTGRGTFVLGFLKANHEPSNHAINNILKSSVKRPTILFYKNESQVKNNTNLSDTKTINQKNIVIGLDRDNKILKDICKEMKINNVSYPLFIIGDTFGHIVYLSEDYQIGLSEHLYRK
ncbi:MAG: transglutaminase domain-containing protein [Bacteroidales bacterium]